MAGETHNERFLSPRDFVFHPQARDWNWTPAEAQAYTAWLATSHYENFHVVSILLPKRLHQDFFNVYAFCRWSDDLGDEIGDPLESLRLLDWWSGELDGMYAGRVQHPVFVALQESVKRHVLPKEPFADLIRAFIHDQTVTRYETWEDVYAYCRYSANPVGRLVLYLCGYRDAERQRLSDSTCTALQLANFWQDVTVDMKKDRIYIPLSVMRKHGYTEEDLWALRFTPGFREVMREIVEEARRLFVEGLALPRMLDRRLAIDIELFSRGGMKVLEKIEALDYNVLAQRPVISKAERVGLLLRTLVGVTFRRAA
ncbi:MAG: squalene synthase HpnC [Acidobacteria bacterium]|nr:squalene synthase HpnC [Acidobacteriota bacterium]